MPEPAPAPKDSRPVPPDSSHAPVPTDSSPVPTDSPLPPAPKTTQPVPTDSPLPPAPKNTPPVPTDSPDPDELPDEPPDEPAPPRRRPAPEPPEPPLDPAGHARLRERIRGLRLLLGLLVLLGLAALLGASRSAARGTGSSATLALHLALWLAAQLAAIALIVLGLRWLRRRRLGPLPSTRLRRPGDVLLHLDAGLGGAVALLGFGPAIAAGRATPLDWAIAATGLLLLALGLRAAVLHVTRV